MIRRMVWGLLALAVCVVPASGQTVAQADSLRAKMVYACGSAKASNTQLTKAIDADSITRDLQWTELGRSRSFTRKAVTECTDAIAFFDRLLGRAPVPIGTPVPTPPPAPVDTQPAPAPVPPSTGAPFAFDDFDGNGTAGLWIDRTDPPPVGVSSDRAFSGASSMRFRYVANSPGQDGWAELRFRLAATAAAAPTEVWLEYYWYVPANYQHRAESPSNNKFLTLWAEGYSGGQEAQFYLSLERQGSLTSSALAIISIHGDDPRYNREGGWFQRPDFVTPADFGKWMAVRVHAKVAREGFVRVWKNGVLHVETGPYNTAYAAGSLNYFRHGYVMGWSNSGFSQQTDFYIDDFKIYRTNPGW